MIDKDKDCPRRTRTYIFKLHCQDSSKRGRWSLFYLGKYIIRRPFLAEATSSDVLFKKKKNKGNRNERGVHSGESVRIGANGGDKSRGSSCSNCTVASRAQVGRFPGHCLLTECIMRLVFTGMHRPGRLFVGKRAIARSRYEREGKTSRRRLKALTENRSPGGQRPRHAGSRKVISIFFFSLYF